MAKASTFIEHYKHTSDWGQAEFDDGTIITDQDVANFVFKHMRFRDMFCLGKVVSATLSAFAILSDKNALEKYDDNWKWTDL